MTLETKAFVCGYRDRIVLKENNLRLTDGDVLCILGPNGVGKTTLFKSILGLIRPLGGSILFNGEALDQNTRGQFSRQMTYVPQAHAPVFPFDVADVVVMGRTVHMKPFSSPSASDYKKVDAVMEEMGIEHLKQANYTRISGGERQMVLIARALVQQPKILIMDEPTASLDYGNQTRVLEQIQRLAKRGMGIIMSSHNPDHAFLCANHVLLLEKDGASVSGPVDEVVTEENLSRTYHTKIKIISQIDEDGRCYRSCLPVLQ